MPGGDVELRGRVLKLLDFDPDLGEALDADRFALANRVVRAECVGLGLGDSEAGDWPAGWRHGLGLLVIEGLLTRRVELSGRFAAELLGPGDLLRPWQADDAVASVIRSSGWRYLSDDCRVAVLDLDFARRIGGFPEIQGQLIARALRRSRYLAITIAILNQPRIDLRLLMLLWHMADRWGVMRHGEVLMPALLPHAVLAELIAARRPTVTTALGALERSGRTTRVEDGWILHAPPPGEFSETVQADPAADLLADEARADPRPSIATQHSGQA